MTNPLGDNLDAQMLSTGEVIRLLRVHRDTLKDWRRNGKGPRFIRLEGSDNRGRVRYPLVDLVQWLKVRKNG